MKPFLDPFPFRAPETRSSIGEVIAEITKGDLKAAEAQDLKELPGKAGEAAHKRLHKTIGKFIKSESVTEGKRGVGAYTVIKKKKTVQKGSAADSTPDTTTTEYDVTRQGVKVGTAQRDNYFGQTSGTVHGKRFSGTGSAQTDLHRFLKSKRGAPVREAVVVESHTRAQLEKMTTTRLRELKTKYEAAVLKGDRDASRELADIRGLLRSKGAGSVLDEGVEGDTHGGGATSPKRKGAAATAKKFRGVPAPVAYTPTTPRGASPLKVSEACGECTTDAIKSLKAANAADLKDKPGAAGKAAHKRLHKTIGKIVKP